MKGSISRPNYFQMCSVEKQLHGQQFNFHECGLCSTNDQHSYSWNSNQRNASKFKDFSDCSSENQFLVPVTNEKSHT